MNLIHRIKNWLESRYGLHIYRSTLPHGADVIFDFRRLGLWPKSPLIFDVGAHLGQTTLALLKTSPQAEVHCFEPASMNHKRLKDELGGNASVHLWQLAFADAPGVLTLHLKPHSTTHSLVNSKGSVEGESVEVDTLDAFCVRHGISRVHFCKIDTEGADLAVLKGGSGLLARHQIDFVQVETSTRRDVDAFSPFSQVDKYLTDLNYELFGVYEQQPCWTGRQSLLYFNAVYVRSSILAEVPAID